MPERAANQYAHKRGHVAHRQAQRDQLQGRSGVVVVGPGRFEIRAMKQLLLKSIKTRRFSDAYAVSSWTHRQRKLP